MLGVVEYFYILKNTYDKKIIYGTKCKKKCLITKRRINRCDIDGNCYI